MKSPAKNPKKLRSAAKAMARKRQIGWFSFSGCEGETIIMTELLNDYWNEWKDKIEFRHARALKTNNVLDELDVAFVEGAITSGVQAKFLRQIRKRSKKLVTVGSCAVIGQPAGLRNFFDEKTKQEIQFLVERFAQSPEVHKVSDIVKVDMEIPGCPMEPKAFLDAFDKLLGF